MERVCLKGCEIHGFLEALAYKTTAAETSKTAYHDVSFPKLRYMCLEVIDFGPTLTNVLLDRLMERYERNAEVKVLHLDCCYCISSDDIKKLKEIVVDVIWDGLEQEFSTDHDSEEDRDYDIDSDGNSFAFYYGDYDDYISDISY